MSNPAFAWRQSSEWTRSPPSDCRPYPELPGRSAPASPSSIRGWVVEAIELIKSLPLEGARVLLADAGISETGFDSYDRLRLSLGIPDGSRDLVLEKSILLEAGFYELNGVDWEKGCYIGQELTARTKYRGLVKRRLMPVAIEGPTPPPGTIVTMDGREVGEMRSSRDGLGLALLRIEPAHDGRTLAAGDATLVPLRPTWMRLENDIPP